MADDAEYCTAANIQEMAGRASNDAKNSTLVGYMPARVRQLIDDACGTWFNQKTRIVYTSPAEEHQQNLYMPAKIISISSIYDNGALVPVSSYCFDDVSIWRVDGGGWSMGHYAYGAGGAMKPIIKVTGVFGYAAVPKDIELFAADLGAVLAGLKIKTFTTGDGISQTVNLTSAPKYIEESLGGHMWVDFSGQVRLVEAVPAP